MDSSSSAKSTNSSPETPIADASLPSSSISLINSILGAGMLGIPLAYAKAGLFPAILVHVLMVIVSYLTFYYLFYSSDATQTFSFGDLGFAFYGINGVDSDSVFTSRWFTGLLMSTFILQPLSWFRTLNALRYTSGLGTLSVCVCVLVIIIRYISPDDDAVARGDSPEFVHKSFSIVQSFSTLTFAFACHQNIPLIHGEIRKRSMGSMYIVCAIALLVTATMFFLAGLFGYLTFTTSLLDTDGAGNILEMYSDSDPLAIVARIATLLVVLFVFPVNSLPARIALYNIINAAKAIHAQRLAMRDTELVSLINKTENDIPIATTTSSSPSSSSSSSSSSITAASLLDSEPLGGRGRCGLLVSCVIGSALTYVPMLLAIFLSDVNLVFDLIGSTAGVAVGFAFPVLFFLLVRRNPYQYVSRERYTDSRYPEMEEENTKRLAYLLPNISSSPSSSSSSHPPRIPFSWEDVVAYAVLVFGIICGLLSFAMAIIFDTSLGDDIDW